MAESLAFTTSAENYEFTCFVVVHNHKRGTDCWPALTRKEAIKSIYCQILESIGNRDTDAFISDAFIRKIVNTIKAHDCTSVCGLWESFRGESFCIREITISSEDAGVVDGELSDLLASFP